MAELDRRTIRRCCQLSVSPSCVLLASDLNSKPVETTGILLESDTQICDDMAHSCNGLGGSTIAGAAVVSSSAGLTQPIQNAQLGPLQAPEFSAEQEVWSVLCDLSSVFFKLHMTAVPRIAPRSSIKHGSARLNYDD